jgi:hypothetical protein
LERLYGTFKGGGQDMTPEQAYKILSDESEAFADAILDLNDRKDYVADLFRPGNSAELYLAQQTLLMAYKDLTKGVTQEYPKAS